MDRRIATIAKGRFSPVFHGDLRLLAVEPDATLFGLQSNSNPQRNQAQSTFKEEVE